MNNIIKDKSRNNNKNNEKLRFLNNSNNVLSTEKNSNNLNNITNKNTLDIQLDNNYNYNTYLEEKINSFIINKCHIFTFIRALICSISRGYIAIYFLFCIKLYYEHYFWNTEQINTLVVFYWVFHSLGNFLSQNYINLDWNSLSNLILVIIGLINLMFIKLLSMPIVYVINILSFGLCLGFIENLSFVILFDLFPNYKRYNILFYLLANNSFLLGGALCGGTIWLFENNNYNNPSKFIIGLIYIWPLLIICELIGCVESPRVIFYMNNSFKMAEYIIENKFENIREIVNSNNRCKNNFLSNNQEYRINKYQNYNNNNVYLKTMYYNYLIKEINLNKYKGNKDQRLNFLYLHNCILNYKKNTNKKSKNTLISLKNYVSNIYFEGYSITFCHKILRIKAIHAVFISFILSCVLFVLRGLEPRLLFYNKQSMSYSLYNQQANFKIFTYYSVETLLVILLISIYYCLKFKNFYFTIFLHIISIILVVLLLTVLKGGYIFLLAIIEAIFQFELSCNLLLNLENSLSVNRNAINALMNISINISFIFAFILNNTLYINYFILSFIFLILLIIISLINNLCNIKNKYKNIDENENDIIRSIRLSE